MKKLISLLLILNLLIIFIGFSTVYADMSNEERLAKNQAEASLEFVRKTILSNKKEYGFKPEDDLSKLKLNLSRGYKVLMPQGSKFDTADKLLDMYKDVNSWCFIIYVGKEPRWTMEMNKKGSRYVLDSFGCYNTEVIDKKLKYLEDYKKNKKINTDIVLIEVLDDTLLVIKNKDNTETILAVYETMDSEDYKYVLEHNDFLTSKEVINIMRSGKIRRVYEGEVECCGMTYFDFRAKEKSIRRTNITTIAIISFIGALSLIYFLIRYRNKRKAKL